MTIDFVLKAASHVIHKIITYMNNDNYVKGKLLH